MILPDNYCSELINYLNEDELFGTRFCEGCAGNIYDPGDSSSPPEWNCHCDYDMSDDRCMRHKEWETVQGLCHQIVQIVCAEKENINA